MRTAIPREPVAKQAAQPAVASGAAMATRLSLGATQLEHLSDELNSSVPARYISGLAEMLSSSRVVGKKEDSSRITQRFYVRNQDIREDQIGSFQTSDPAKAVLRRWVGDNNIRFQNPTEAVRAAEIAAGLALPQDLSPQTAIQDAELLKEKIGGPGTDRYLRQVQDQSPGIVAHHHEMRRYAEMGTLRNVEEEFYPDVNPRYADIVSKEGNRTFHVEVKDYAVDRQHVPDNEVQRFSSQFADNLSYLEQSLTAAGQMGQRYIFVRGIPEWAFNIMTTRTRRYVGRTLYGFRLNTNLFNLPGVGDAHRVEVNFFYEDPLESEATADQELERWRANQPVNVSKRDIDLAFGLYELARNFYQGRGLWERAAMQPEDSDQLSYAVLMLQGVHDANTQAIIDGSRNPPSEEDARRTMQQLQQQPNAEYDEQRDPLFLRMLLSKVYQH